MTTFGKTTTVTEIAGGRRLVALTKGSEEQFQQVRSADRDDVSRTLRRTQLS